MTELKAACDSVTLPNVIDGVNVDKTYSEIQSSHEIQAWRILT